ncbi:MAG: hypothetical protein ABI895_15100 [Deltaproteobacteria bacterium]
MQPSLSTNALWKAAIPKCALLKLLAVGVSICGCNLDSNFSDLGEKLLDPDVQGFDTPGQRWLSGPYFDLSQQSDADGTRYALARNEAGELSIYDLAAKTQCHTGSVARYGDAIVSPGQPALIPLLSWDAQGVLQLGFSTLGCDQLAFQVPTGGLPLDVLENMPTASGTGLLIRTPEQGLALIDPWSESSQLLARSVRASDPASAFGHYLWVENGHIVISDRVFTPIARFGEKVTEIVASPQDAELAYLEPTPDAAGGTLFVVDALGSQEPREIASDVCALRYLSIGSSRKLSYFSPCADRRLVLRDRSDESTLVIADGVAGAPSVYRIGRDWRLAYVTTPSPDTNTGTLWLREAVEGAEPTVIAENTRVNLSSVTPYGAGLLTTLDWSNSSGGRLVEWRGEGLTDVADKVIEIAPLGLLANEDLTLLGNFDGTTGDLLRLNRDLSTEVLASGVPQRAASEDAFLANFDGSQGELRLFHRQDGSSDLLGTRVSRGSFKFAQQFKGVMMLSGRDPETNTSSFEVHLLDSGQSHLLNTGVTEAREVAFPSAGLMYNVVEGDRTGVWFSKTL